MKVQDAPLTTTLARNWWLLLLRGILSIAFGILTWRQPEASLAVMVLFFGFYTIADGIVGICLAIQGRKENEDWWVLLLWGIVGVFAGILTLAVPGLSALALLFYVAIWAITTGILQIVFAIRVRKEIEGEWLLILGGIASVIFGILLMARPEAGTLTLLWMIATYAFIFGIILVIMAFKARSFRKA